MKGICTGYTNGVYLFKFTGETPGYGNEYDLEPAAEGTAAQRKLFNSLAHVYYNSGQHNDDKIDFFTFREVLKKNLGEGFKSIVYADLIDGKTVIKKVKKFEDLPEHIRNSPDRNEMTLGKLKSMADYTKKQYRAIIDNLISEMLQVEVKDNKFQEILRGINYELL